MSDKIEELRKNLTELQQFYSSAQRDSNKTFLHTEIKRLTTLIASLEKPKVTEAKKNEPVAPKRYITELSTYAWDQSDKFVKIFVTLDGIQNIENPEENVIADFTEKSLKVTITNFQNKDYSFTVTNLLQNIDVAKSYKKVKSDMVAVYLKKATEGINWSHLTATAKQIKDMKDSMYKDDPSSDPNDPSAGLMSLMKKMYETGTPEIKQTIAKAWTESQDKQRSGDFSLPN